MIYKRDVKEFLQIIVLLGVSLIGGRAGILAFYALGLIFVYNHRAAGATKILMLLAYRSIVNDAMFYAISGMQSIKWGVMFGISAYILFGFKIPSEKKRKLSKVYPWMGIFAVYIVMDSFLVSSLPIISIFKFFSYAFVFVAILKGIALTYYNVDWINWLEKLLASMVILSIPLYGTSGAWLGNLFKGFTNQPNMLGIVLVLFVTLLVINLFQLETGRYIRVGMVALSFALIFLSGSRTGFISALIIVILGISLAKMRIYNKVAVLILLIGMALLVINTNGTIGEYLNEFIYKYDASSTSGSLLYSRESQIEELVSNIASNPILGIGFATPRLDFVSYTFSYTFFMEPGNLVLAIMSYSGILGTMLFVAMLLSIIFSNYKHNNILILLPVATIIVSMGEMVFFSSNSMAIWLYAFWGIYMFNRTDIVIEE